MTNQMNTHATSHDDHEHHGGTGIYLAVAVALVFLTACSYWTYTPLWPFGENIAIKRLWMMAVSCTKAMLVIMFFMHLKWEANWKWVLTVPASIMSALLILALVPDVGLRMRPGPWAGPSFQRMIHAAEVSAVEHEVPITEEGHDGHVEPPHTAPPQEEHPPA